MTNINKKTPAGATNTNEGNESDQHSNNNHSTLIYGHIAKRGQSTGLHIVTWGGEKLSHDDYLTVKISRDDADRAFGSPNQFQMCEHCMEEILEDARRRLEKEREQEQREREHAALLAEEKRLIKNITGMDLVRDDLVIFMTQARRDGGDFQPFLDALQALDDLDLERAGLTSWDDELDEEGDF